MMSSIHAPRLMPGDLVARHAEIAAHTLHPTGEHVPVTEAEAALTPLHRWQRMVAIFGENDALAEGERTLTYAALNVQANRLAHAIIARDLPRDKPIALLLMLEWDLPIAILAAWKAGHPFVWLEPTQPFARNQYMATEACAPVVITNRQHEEVARQLWPDGADVFVLDAVDDRPLDIDAANHDPPNTLVGSSPAYLMYTSGSTGKPKATVELHRNLMYMLLERCNPFHFSTHDRVAMLVLGGGGYTMMCALMYGVCLLPFQAKYEGLTRLTQWIIEQRVTVLIDAAMLRTWLLMLEGREHFPDVRVFILGAGPTYREHVEAFQRFLPDTCVLANFYSATEVRSIAFLLLDHASQLTTRLVPVGVSPDWVEIEIWDDADRALPVGTTGEIVVFSSYVAAGYWQSPTLTAAKFGVDRRGRHYCRMGDLGKVDEQGCLWVLGRKDGQLKIRDNRVETAEIEVALLELPGVRDVAVVHLGEVENVRDLIAFVEADAPLSGSALRKQLADLLPEYMLPATIIVQGELPRNDNGKIARPLLREMARAFMTAADKSQAAQPNIADSSGGQSPADDPMPKASSVDYEQKNSAQQDRPATLLGRIQRWWQG